MKIKKHWPDYEVMDHLRDKLRKKITLDELEASLRLEAMDALLTVLDVDAETLHRLWIQPLMAAGASMDVALMSIARSCFQPN